MSARSQIVKALAQKLKEIDGTGTFSTNLYGNVYTRMKFWDEVQDYPTVCLVPASEEREYLPSQFKWGFLSVSIKVYVKGDDPGDLLEAAVADIEKVIDANQRLVYGSTPYDTTEQISIKTIMTDEGLLDPIGIADVGVLVQYLVK